MSDTIPISVRCHKKGIGSEVFNLPGEYRYVFRDDVILIPGGSSTSKLGRALEGLYVTITGFWISEGANGFIVKTEGDVK